jgi:hypothetical protein
MDEESTIRRIANERIDMKDMNESTMNESTIDASRARG